MACMAQRGLLTLRNCNNPEARNCAKCGRPTCSEHLSARSEAIERLLEGVGRNRPAPCRVGCDNYQTPDDRVGTAHLRIVARASAWTFCR